MSNDTKFTSMLSVSRRQLLRTSVVIGAAGVLASSLISTAAMAQSEARKTGGIMRVAVPGGSADSLDPHRTQGQISDIVRFCNLFDGLCEFKPDASVGFVLAESFTPNGDATEWTLSLRSGVKTHAGKDFTADDVIYSVKRILDKEHPSKGAALISFIDPTKVEKVDDLTVRFMLAAPNGLFSEVWANRYLKMVPRDFDPAAPVGTGPFKYVSFTPGQESVFDRFDGYFRERAWVDQLVISVINDNTAAINALRGGQVEITYTMPFAQARVISADPSLKLLNNPSAMSIPIYMRTDIAPFDDPKVRMAMKLIANREQMVKIALAGYGAIGNDMAGRTIAPCGESTLPQRKQDIAKAKELLKEAGKSDLTIEMVTVNGTAGMIECAQVFAEQAKAAGVTINVKVVEVGAYLAKYGQWSFGVDFLSDTYLAVATRSLLPTGTFNTSHWNDAEFIDLHKQAMATADITKRCDIIAKMRQIEYERGGNIVWGFANTLNGYRANVKGLVPYTVDSALYSLRTVWFA
ncbi:peptide ABC transporter substrate-binding protein [Rhizobium sp. ICMP 5592]|nr:ABC transporter substrate-binding protein [Rhizobium sp. ICMP 5592]MQB46225.1 peptide ABC transporter substrate-binding protein [Rhizobium sp. ICMP 5592]